MPKTREEMERELKQLDAERRECEVRLRSIEQSPRNRRLVQGDFSRPARRVGDTRPLAGRGGTDRFYRARGRDEDKEDEDDTPRKKARLNVTLKKDQVDEAERMDDEAAKEEDKEHEDEQEDETKKADTEQTEEGNDDDDSATKGGEDKDAPKRRTAGRGAGATKRDRRFFGSLMGHLGSARSARQKESSSERFKKMKEVEEKVTKKIMEKTEQVLKQEAADLIEEKKTKSVQRLKLMRQEETMRRELEELINREHVELLGKNFILTGTEPRLYFLPKTHTGKTKKLLERCLKESETHLEQGEHFKETDQDQANIDALFEHERTEEEADKDIEMKAEEDGGEEAAENGNEEDKEERKDNDKNGDGENKDSDNGESDKVDEDDK